MEIQATNYRANRNITPSNSPYSQHALQHVNTKPKYKCYQLGDYRGYKLGGGA